MATRKKISTKQNASVLCVVLNYLPFHEDLYLHIREPFVCRILLHLLGFTLQDGSMGSCTNLYMLYITILVYQRPSPYYDPQFHQMKLDHSQTHLRYGIYTFNVVILLQNTFQQVYSYFSFSGSSISIVEFYLVFQTQMSSSTSLTS